MIELEQLESRISAMEYKVNSIERAAMRQLIQEELYNWVLHAHGEGVSRRVASNLERCIANNWKLETVYSLIQA